MFFIFILFFFKTFSSFFFKKFFLTTLSFFTVFWFLTIFVYTYNLSKTSRFVSAYNRFWRRSFVIFWFIEIYLFSIYIYLVLNCPVETEWLANQSQLYTSNYLNLFNLSKSLLVCVIILFSLKSLPFTNNNIFLYKHLPLMIFSLMLLDEFYQFFFLSSFISYDLESYSFLDRVWECSNLKHPSLVLHQYSFLVSFLKFWHILYVFFFLCLDFFFFSQDLTSRPRSLKYSLTNIIFLVIFCNVQLVVPIKLYLNFIFLQPYSSFYTHSFFNYLLCI